MESLQKLTLGLAACAFFSTALHAQDIVFEEDFVLGLGQFTSSGSVSVSSGAAVLRAGWRGNGIIKSPPIDVSGYDDLTLNYQREVRYLDAGESATVAFSVDGGEFVALESISDGAGAATLTLPAAADGAQQVVLQFAVDASNYFESYAIRDISLSGTRSEPDDPDNPDEPDNPEDPDQGDGECNDAIDLSSRVLIDGFGFNNNNTRNAESLINSQNVAKLQLAYSYVSENTDTKRGTPAVTDQAIFFYGTSTLHAINRNSGCEYWHYDNVNDVKFKTSSVLLVPELGMLFVGDYKGYVHAVDAVTGELKWRKFAGIEGNQISADGHLLTGGMLYQDRKLVVPVSSIEVLKAVTSPCCYNHGMVRAYEALTGLELWEYHTTEEARYGLQSQGPSGAPVWSTPTIDSARNSVYIGTGQNYSRPATGTSDAIISLDLDTGKQKWVFQAREGDIWNAHTLAVLTGSDFDFGASPVLLEDGSTLIAGDKGGFVYSLNPDTGALNWKRRIGSGGTLGGVHWNMAVDDTHVYVAIADVSSNKVDSDLTVDDGKARPGVYALSLSDGEPVWEQHPTHRYQGNDVPSLFSASISVTNDLVFAAALDGETFAFHKATGEQLWSFNTDIETRGVNGIAGNGGTIDSVGAVMGGDTLLILSGYNVFGGTNRFQGGPGNAMFVFRLPETAQ